MIKMQRFWLFVIVAAMIFALIPKAAYGQTISGTEHEWSFTYFGSNVSKTTNRVLSSGTGIESPVSLSAALFNEDGSINKKGGKFVADSPADGASYYYTEIDPSKENFVLQADVIVDRMNPAPDGQEGFALMVRDAIWDANTKGSCMANLMSVAGTGLPEDSAISSSKNGDTIGFRGYTGVCTPEASDENTILSMRYAWWKDTEGHSVKIAQGGCYRLRLEKTSNSYIGTQYKIGENGETEEVIGTYTYYIPAKDYNATEVRSYEELDDPMSVQEKQKAYVALVAARGMDVTFQNISFETSEWKASEWKPQPDQTIDPDYRILSTETSGSETYELIFRTNADGTAEISRGDQVLDRNVRICANTRWTKAYDLTGDETAFSVRFTPDPDYRISVFEKLSDYLPKTVTVTVTRRMIGTPDQGFIYVRADGLPSNSGTSMDDALDLLTALRFVRPGQTILLKSERYLFTDGPLLIEQGRNGREDAPITMTTEDNGFATFDFDHQGKGLQCRGDYWQFSRLNITNTANACEGMILAGSHNTLTHMNFYNNGNTGLLICGLSPDEKSLWPSCNSVINCTSVNNADQAMEDADGFASKLMSGEGNVFQGCIAAFNADDGWDIFAKISTGPIGRLEIKNCVAFKNGYLKVKEGGTIKEHELVEIQPDGSGSFSFADGIEIEAGNGNGFKLGGSNLTGKHCLIDSIAYDNKKKGIDSNSCPDIVVSGCVSFNNVAENVRLYTNNASAVTDFEVDRVISYRKGKNMEVGDSIFLQGQDESQLRNDSNYFWDAGGQRAVNSLGQTVRDDWFYSLDTAILPEWGENGTVNMHGLLCLREQFRGTGVFKRDGKYRYYEKGNFRKVTGVAFCPEDGKWRYVENGVFAAKTGVVKRLSDGKWVYVKKGLFSKVTGAAKRLSDGKKLYVRKGVFQRSTGVVKLLNSKQSVYVRNGIFQKTTGVVKLLDSKHSVYVRNGIFQKKTGLVKKNKKQWVFLRDGILVTNPKKIFLTKADAKAGREEILCEVFARAVYNKVVKPKMTKAQKLRACFYYLTPEKHFHYLNTRIPYYTAPDGAVVNTLDMIKKGGSTSFGFSSLFAYLAKLCGCRNVYFCWSSDHGWAEINGLIYDPAFLGAPHFKQVLAVPYETGRGMGLGTDYVKINRYKIPEFK